MAQMELKLWNSKLLNGKIFGSWDNWKNGSNVNGFEINLPNGKYYYKYLNDEKWECDWCSVKEFDSGGNENNVLIIKENELTNVKLILCEYEYDNSLSYKDKIIMRREKERCLDHMYHCKSLSCKSRWSMMDLWDFNLDE